MSRTLRQLISLAYAGAALASSALHAQDVQYSTITKVDLGGAMNTMMRFAGGTEFKETSYIKGKKLRSDGDKQSLIFDIENNRYIAIDHQSKTYTSVPLADFVRATTPAMRATRADPSTGQLKGTAVDSAGNKADYTIDFQIEPTDERRNVNGNDAKRVLLTMVTDIDVTPEGETQAQNAGKLVLLMDTWNANTGPASDAVRAWEQATSKELAAAAFGRSDFGSAFAANPKMGEAVKKASVEAQKVEGMTVLSTMHLVLVGPDQKFDRALALKEAEAASAPKSKGMGGLMGRAIASAAGVKEPKPDTKQGTTATQATIAKVTTEVRDVKATSLPSTLFDVPAGYREVKPR